jgi:tetratricopeptide (TPR) repeat protein
MVTAARALDQPGAREPSVWRCAGLFTLGQDQYFAGRYEEASDTLAEGLELARGLGDDRWLMRLSYVQANAAMAQERFDAARSHSEQALAVARRLGDAELQATVVSGLVMLHRLVGAIDEARTACMESVALARASGRADALVISLVNQAAVESMAQRPAAAAQALGEAGERVADLGSVALAQFVVDCGSGLAADRAEWGLAAALHGAAEAMILATGLHRDPADDLFVRPRIAAARTELGASAFDLSVAQGRGWPEAEARRRLQAWLATGPTVPGSVTASG